MTNARPSGAERFEVVFGPGRGHAANLAIDEGCEPSLELGIRPSDVGETCPYCDHQAADARAEIAHMEAEHPEIIRARLEDAGFVHSDGQWIDTLT